MSDKTPRSAPVVTTASNTLVSLKFQGNTVEMSFAYLPRVGEMIIFDNDSSKYTVDSIAHHVQRTGNNGSCNSVEIILK